MLTFPVTAFRGSSSPIPELSVVIPIYHEQDNIALTLATLVPQIPVSHEILCVYDEDNDPTLPLLRDLQNDRPTIPRTATSSTRGPCSGVYG